MSCSSRCCEGAGGKFNLNELPEPKNLTKLYEGLEIIYTSCEGSVDGCHEAVKKYMGRYRSNQDDWKKFRKFDDHKYTRNLVGSGNEYFNLIVLCWNYGQGSTIHGHANSHCFMKILEGTAKEEHFDMPEDAQGEHEMVPTVVYEHNVDEVTYIADRLGKVHRVSNPSNSEQLVTLHLYSPPLKTCKIFDEKTSHVTTGQMTFHSIDGVVQ